MPRPPTRVLPCSRSLSSHQNLMQFLCGGQAPRQLKRKDREPESWPAAAPGGGSGGLNMQSKAPAAKRCSSLGSAGAACEVGGAPPVGMHLDSAGAAGRTEGRPPISTPPAGAREPRGSPAASLRSDGAAQAVGDAPHAGMHLDGAVREPADAPPGSMHLDGAAPEPEGARLSSTHPDCAAPGLEAAPPPDIPSIIAPLEPEGAPHRGSGALPLPMEGTAAAPGGAAGVRPGSGQAALPQVPALGVRADLAAAPPLPLFHSTGGGGGPNLNRIPGPQPAGAGTASGQGAMPYWAAQGGQHVPPGLGLCVGFGGLAGPPLEPALLPRASACGAAAWELSMRGDRGVGLMPQSGLGMPCMADAVQLGPWPLSLALPMAYPGMGSGYGPEYGYGVPPFQAQTSLGTMDMAGAAAMAAKWHAAIGPGTGPAQQELHMQQHMRAAHAAQAASAWGPLQGQATLCQYPYERGEITPVGAWRDAAPRAAAQPAPGPALLGNGALSDPNPMSAGLGTPRGAGAPHAPLNYTFPTLPQPAAGGHSSGSAGSGAGPSSGLGLGVPAGPPGSARSEGDVWIQFLRPCTSPCKAHAG